MDSRQVRPAGRVIVLDATQACLLARVTTPDASWLFTPGGGVHGDEDTLAAARRETVEETSLRVGALAGPVLYRRAHFTFLGSAIEARETFWVATVRHRPTIRASRLDDYERDLLGDWRWLTATELRSIDVAVYPRCLPELLAALGSPTGPDNPLAGAPAWVEEETGDGVAVSTGTAIPTWAAS